MSGSGGTLGPSVMAGLVQTARRGFTILKAELTKVLIPLVLKGD